MLLLLEGVVAFKRFADALLSKDHNSPFTVVCQGDVRVARRVVDRGRTYIHNSGRFNCTSTTSTRQHYKLDSNIVRRLAQLDDIRTGLSVNGGTFT
ncbi:hypothetical protein GOP47_0028289 [Adiantum capillus-veneris]|nr:hypothetical protein GOP47_0028289 [Adiantum capillus-veneris]